LDTFAIQKTVDAASAAGGGTVLVPAGRYVTGTLTLASRINLHLAANAVILIDHDLARANALKNVLLFVADLLPAVLFALAGPVAWAAVLPLGLGALAGGLIGPRVMRRAPRSIVRLVIAVLALGLAVWLLLQAVFMR
jgi:uncharacterized membrane protein YfcA